MESEELAALAAQYNSVEDDVLEVEPEAIEEAEEIEEAEFIDEDEEAAESPPGFIDNMEDWIAAGKDPDMFKGKKAYQAEYKRIQDNKELASTVKAMQATLKSTVDAIAQREEETAARHRKELEFALNRAKEDGDTDAALDAAEQLHTLRNRPVSKESHIHPVLAEYIEHNPVLMNEEVKEEFARLYNGKLRADGVGASDQLSEAALKGYAREAMDGVKRTYPERFASPKNQRQSMVKVKSKPATRSLDIVSALKSYAIDGASSKNESAAYGLYKTLLSNHGQEAADNYAKNLLGIKS